jgi:predicted ATPase
LLPWKLGRSRPELLAEAHRVLSLKTGTCPVDTNWCVLTGPPSSGKTALAAALAERGYERTIEPVREYFRLQESQGRTRAELWASPGATVGPIHQLRLRIEESLDPDQLVFLDTAVPDTLVYGLLFDTVPSELLAALRRHRYSKVFLLEPIALKSDPLRTPLAHLRGDIFDVESVVYTALGTTPVRVPPLPLAERARFVLERVEPRFKP